MGKKYTPPTQKQIDIVDRKLDADGYIYNSLIKAKPRPNFEHYLLFERNMIQGIIYNVFVSSVQHISKPRFVRIRRECFYLDNYDE